MIGPVAAATVAGSAMWAMHELDQKSSLPSLPVDPTAMTVDWMAKDTERMDAVLKDAQTQQADLPQNSQILGGRPDAGTAKGRLRA